MNNSAYQSQQPTMYTNAAAAKTIKAIQAPSQAFIPPRNLSISSAPSAPVAAARRQVKTEPASSLSPPSVGKHNKTERRYRQKVQAAQADLRDAVPALRVLYGTSTDEQRATTDFRDVDGTVDGLGEITRPNASAKTTIFLGARMYIELLQSRVASDERRIAELEAFRMAVAGEEDLMRWRADFEHREAELRASMPARGDSSEDGADDDESSEEDEPKRKKPKKAAARGSASSAAGMRAFAAFAMSFTLLPSATKLVGPSGPSSSGQSLDMATGRVLGQLPLITAEHISRLLANYLPQILTPGPQALVDWTWRILCGCLLYIVLRPLFQRKKSESTIGSVTEMVKDAALMLVRSGKNETDDSRWVSLAAGILGKGERDSAFTSSTRLTYCSSHSSNGYDAGTRRVATQSNRLDTLYSRATRFDPTIVPFSQNSQCSLARSSIQAV